MPLIAFIAMSLAWSFSWIAMKFQVVSFVPLELSVFYRIAATGILMLLICLFAKQRVFINRKELPFFVFVGAGNFSFNFLIGYHAAHYIPTGMIAVIFSLSIIATEIIGSFVHRRKIERKVLLSSLVGFIGLGFFVLPSINFSEHASSTKVITGVLIVLVMVLVYSVGNVMLGKNQKTNSTPFYTTITYGCFMGSLWLLALNLIKGNSFEFDFSSSYILSFVYLVIIASVIAFICMLYMIQTVGVTKANYTALAYPTIALIVSSYYEGFQFVWVNSLGLIMIVSALAIEFLPGRKKSKKLPEPLVKEAI